MPDISFLHSPRVPARRAARLAVIAAACVSALTGCGSLYLHSDAAQKATAGAKSELDKLNLATVFDNEASYLDELEKREYVVVSESLTAQRDDDLLKMLQGRGIANGDGRAFMAQRIDRYLEGVAGTSDRGGTTRLWRLIDNARSAAVSGTPLAETLEAVLARDRTKVRAPPGDRPSLQSPSGVKLDQAIAAAEAATADAKAKEAAAQAAKKSLQDDLKKAEEDLSAGNASQKTFTDLLTKVKKFLEESKEQANPYLAQYVSETLQENLDELIKVTDPNGIEAPQETKARAAIGLVHAAFGVGDAFSDPPRVPHPNALSAAQSWMRYVAGQAETQLKEIQAVETIERARLAAVVEQVYYLSRAGEALEPIQSKPLGDREGLAKLMADKDPTTSRAASAAFYYYAAAWTKGFIPAQQLNQVAEPIASRRAKLQASRQSGDAWLGTLKPAVATLAAYGEGGIDPHLVAELLLAIGIGAVAVGVN